MGTNEMGKRHIEFIVFNGKRFFHPGMLSEKSQSTHKLGFSGYDLLQYTGFKDKNEAKIYEGNIIKFRDPTLNGIGGTFIGVVHFELGCFRVESEGMFNLLLCNCLKGMLCDDGNDNRTEVIGHILTKEDIREATNETTSA